MRERRRRGRRERGGRRGGFNCVVSVLQLFCFKLVLMEGEDRGRRGEERGRRGSTSLLARGSILIWGRRKEKMPKAFLYFEKEKEKEKEKKRKLFFFLNGSKRIECDKNQINHDKILLLYYYYSFFPILPRALNGDITLT